MAYEQWYPDETKDELMAFILAVIATGILAGGGYLIYKACNKTESAESKTEQVAKVITPKNVIAYNNIKTL